MFSTPQLCGGHGFFSLISATDVDPCGVGVFVYDQKQVPKNKQRVDVVQLMSKRFYHFAVGSHAALIKWKGCQQWQSLIRCAHMAPKIWRSAEPFMSLDESSGRIIFSNGSPRRKQKVVAFSLFPCSFRYNYERQEHDVKYKKLNTAFYSKYQTMPLSPGSGARSTQSVVRPILLTPTSDISLPSRSSDCTKPHLPAPRSSGASS
jgi:hypothetical protein